MATLGPLVGAIDQGTSSTRFLVFSASTGELVTYHQMEVKRILPIEGWVEQDPVQIFNSVIECIDMVAKKLKDINVDISTIKCIGLTNQRESTIIWDKFTGNCICFQFLKFLELFLKSKRTGGTAGQVFEPNQSS